MIAAKRKEHHIPGRPEFSVLVLEKNCRIENAHFHASYCILLIFSLGITFAAL